MLWLDFTLRFSVSIAVMSICAWLYVAALLRIGGRFRGFGRSALSLLAYVAIALCVGVVGIYILGPMPWALSWFHFLRFSAGLSCRVAASAVVPELSNERVESRWLLSTA